MRGQQKKLQAIAYNFIFWFNVLVLVYYLLLENFSHISTISSFLTKVFTAGSVLVYNETFEKPRLKELAELCPDLADDLLRIRENVVDLFYPIRKGYYYNKAMKNSTSIKSVLPAMFPNDPELDYHNLEGVHNGGEAMTIFPKIKDMPKEEQEIARKNLLKYCELDTLATVKLWQKLIELSK